MCIPTGDGSLRTRSIVAIANIALFGSIVLPDAIHPTGNLSKDWLDALRGLLVGLWIGMNLFVLKLDRRLPASAKR